MWAYLQNLLASLRRCENIILKEQYPVILVFWPDVANSRDVKNLFASRLAKFDTTLKVLRIKDQWYIVLKLINNS